MTFQSPTPAPFLISVGFLRKVLDQSWASVCFLLKVLMMLQTTHVPKWKQLGLKLKYARDSPVPSPDLPEESTNTLESESKEHTAGQTSPPPNKKRRLDVPSSAAVPSANPTRLKKKVSFTPETKTTDGESGRYDIHIVYDPAPPADYSTSTTKSQPYETAPTEKRNKEPSKWAAAPPSRKTTDALDYLKQHHDQNPIWKFNKNREVWILKHAISTHEIPAEYEDALLGYLRGLKSTGARQRLREQCQARVRAAHGSGSSTQKLSGSGLKDGTTPGPTRKPSEQVARAQKLLGCLEDSPSSSGVDLQDRTEEGVQGSESADTKPKGNKVEPQEERHKRKKKKKSRTAVVADSESSSSSNSSDRESEG